MKIDFDRPSMHGKFLGDLLVRIAREGRKANPFLNLPEMCLTCAFRTDTFPNLAAGTGLHALNCVTGVDQADFCCHHGMKDGDPTRVCAGYVAAKLAPFEITKQLLVDLMGGLNRFSSIEKGDGYVDSIRAEFDAWYVTADPEGKMDAYQLARAYAGR